MQGRPSGMTLSRLRPKFTEKSLHCICSERVAFTVISVQACSFGKTNTVGFSCTTSGNCQLNLLFFFFSSHSGTPEAPWERSRTKRGRNQCLLLSPQSPKVPRSSMPEKQNVFLGSQPRQNFQLPVPRSSHKPLWEEQAPEAPSSPMLADRNPYSC